MAVPAPLPLYVDLTELRVGSAGKRGFYGIARVVAELAQALEVPAASGPGRGSPQALQALPPPVFVVHRRWRRRFQPARLQAASAADLDLLQVQPLAPQPLAPGVLLSAARPRLLARYGPALARQRLQLVPLIHDLFPLVDDHDRPSPRFRRRFLAHNRQVLAQAPLVLANSQATAAALHQGHRQGLLPLLPPLAVLPLAHECRPSQRQGTTAAGELAAVVPPEPYLLLVGPRLGRRNLQAVLAALGLLRAAGQPCPLLVLAGAERRSTSRALASAAHGPIRDRLRLVPSPHQAQLEQLYRGALALVLPSYLEGWGLPAAEALWLGTPVLAAAIPVMEEVCGPLARYFPPDQPPVLAALIAELLEDPAGRDAWAAQVVAARGQLRSWRQVAAELQELLAPLRRGGD